MTYIALTHISSNTLCPYRATTSCYNVYIQSVHSLLKAVHESEPGLLYMASFSAMMHSVNQL